MKLAPALLEEWMRDHYFEASADIGSSGVENFSLADLRELVGFRLEDLDQIVFHDSHTLGGPGLRSAIANRFLGGDVDPVMVTHGSTEANFLIMNTLLRPGDEVLVLDPSYQQLYGIAEALGCTLKHWPLREERQFEPDLEELSRLIGPTTRMVVVNFPHNPTGVTLSHQQQQELIDIVAGAGAYLVWDAAFAELTYDAPPLPEPVLQYERALSTGTLSKAYGLPGLRVGWCLAAPALLERMIRFRDYLTLHLSPLVELIAQKAIENADAIVDLRMKQARTNLAMVQEWIARHSEAVDWPTPQGGVCGFIRLEGEFDVDDFCRRLTRESGTLLIPGSCFNHPRRARLGFGCAPTELEKGLESLSLMLSRAHLEVPA